MSRQDAHVWLLAYDIASPKRWQRIHRIARSRFHRVNYSVFIGQAPDREIENIAAELALLIDDRADDVRFYALPRQARTWIGGRGRPLVCRSAEELLADLDRF